MKKLLLILLCLPFIGFGQLTYGCTDSLACNYDPLATIDDSSCLYSLSASSILTTTSVYYPHNGFDSYNLSCLGCNDGWIKINISGGFPPFTFLWSNGSTNDSIYNLYAGYNSVVIIDSLGCSIEMDFTLIEPPLSIKDYTMKKELLKVTDILGRETKQTNQPLFYIYDDGTVEKRVVIE